MSRRSARVAAAALVALVAGCDGASRAPRPPTTVPPQPPPPAADVARPPEPLPALPTYPQPTRPVENLRPVWAAELPDTLGPRPTLDRLGKVVRVDGNAPGAPLHAMMIDLARRTVTETPAAALAGVYDTALVSETTVVGLDRARRVLVARAVDSPRELWQRALPEEQCVLARVLVGPWLVVIGGNCAAGIFQPAAIHGIDTRTGLLVWTRPAGGPGLGWPSMWTDGARVFLTRITGPSGALEVVDPRTGQLAWSAPLPAWSCGASSDGRWVLVDAPPDHRDVRRAIDGAVERRIDAHVPVCRHMGEGGSIGNSQTALSHAGSAIYWEDHDLVLADLASGAITWRQAGYRPRGAEGTASLHATSDVVFVRGPGNRVVALDRATGAATWEWGVAELGWGAAIGPVEGSGDDQPWLVVQGRGLQLFARDSAPAPPQTVVIRGRLAPGPRTDARDVADRQIEIAGQLFVTDGRGRFEATLTTRGTVHVEVVTGPRQWQRDRGRHAIAADPVDVTLDTRSTYDVGTLRIGADRDADG